MDIPSAVKITPPSYPPSSFHRHVEVIRNVWEPLHFTTLSFVVVDTRFEFGPRKRDASPPFRPPTVEY